MASCNLSRIRQCIYSKIFPELTIKNERAEHWLGENGIIFSIITFVFDIYFLRNAIKKIYDENTKQIAD